MEKTKCCKDCGKVFPETRDYFGQYPTTRANGEVKISYRNSCRECMAANTAAHAVRNPEMGQKRSKDRAERAKKSGGSYTEAELAGIRAALSNRCRFCDTPLEESCQVEHLTPVSRGGSSFVRNLTLSCAKCNKAKHNKTLEEFVAWRKERSLPVRQIVLPDEHPDMPTGKAGRTPSTT
jgi:5-methylcytosine-specific restriction endonuclease McrA